MTEGPGGSSFTAWLSLDRQLEGTNTATLVGLSLKLARERDFIVKLNALMVRYIVNDVDKAIAFYTHHLGFRVSAQSGPYWVHILRFSRGRICSSC